MTPLPGRAATDRARAPPLRVVLDTNLVLSALVFGGRTAWLRTAWQQRHILPVVSRDTVLELARVLAYPKFRLDRAEQDALMAEYLPWAEPFVAQQPWPEVPECSDRDNIIFLRLAVAAQVAALVSGDAAVAALNGRLAVPVISAAQLRGMLPPAG